MVARWLIKQMTYRSGFGWLWFVCSDVVKSQLSAMVDQGADCAVWHLVCIGLTVELLLDHWSTIIHWLLFDVGVAVASLLVSCQLRPQDG